MAEEKRNTIKLETHITVGPETSSFQVEKRRAAIRAALHSAVSGLAATTSGLAMQAAFFEGDGGTPPAPPPWGEVIIGPVWEQANPPDGGTHMRQIAELFW